MIPICFGKVGFIEKRHTIWRQRKGQVEALMLCLCVFKAEDSIPTQAIQNQA